MPQMSIKRFLLYWQGGDRDFRWRNPLYVAYNGFHLLVQSNPGCMVQSAWCIMAWPTPADSVHSVKNRVIFPFRLMSAAIERKVITGFNADGKSFMGIFLAGWMNFWSGGDRNTNYQSLPELLLDGFPFCSGDFSRGSLSSLSLFLGDPHGLATGLVLAQLLLTLHLHLVRILPPHLLHLLRILSPQERQLLLRLHRIARRRRTLPTPQKPRLLRVFMGTIEGRILAAACRRRRGLRHCIPNVDEASSLRRPVNGSSEGPAEARRHGWTSKLVSSRT